MTTRTIRASEAGIEILAGAGAPVVAAGAVLLGSSSVASGFRALMFLRSARASKASLGRVRKLARSMWVHLPLGIRERETWKRVYAEAKQRSSGSGRMRDDGSWLPPSMVAKGFR